MRAFRFGLRSLRCFCCTQHPAAAEDISGVITVTRVIVENSQLVGDVTCTMTTTPCIQFGAPNIALRLNGHIITGPANPDDTTTCQPTSGPPLRTASATGPARPRASQACKSSAPAWCRSSGGTAS